MTAPIRDEQPTNLAIEDRPALALAVSGEEAARRDALVGRLLESCVQAGEVAAVYLGEQLGFYRALAELGPATSAELATRAGVHERHAREWLEEQAVAGILDVSDPTVSFAARCYSLPAGHAEVLLDRNSMNYLGPVSRQLIATLRQAPAIIDAFRTGGGVPWSAYGPEMREGQADLNRPSFLHQLAAEWFPAIPDVQARLLAQPPARIADIGCGGGWSSIAIAQGYPNVHVDGYDSDMPSIDMARRNAVQAGVADRVRFHAVDGGDPSLAGTYDLVTVFEALHDMSHPVDVLRTIRRLLAPGGAAVIMDERVPEQFSAPGELLDRFFYMVSVLVCLPAGMAEAGSSGTGTVMRPSTLRRYAVEAGFQDVQILPIDNFFFRFYRLIP
jgi:2-polyprenyl-3-methyl-5-hydroxy-6-metoxy-1,4-benzoquinol methylase